MRKRLEKVVDLGARRAWLWRHRGSFGGHAAGKVPRLLVDVSAIIRHDAQTGIQRVVRAVWSELTRRNGASFELVPVFASSSHGYCYAAPDFLENKADYGDPQPVRVARNDIFLGLDLTAHLLPKYSRQLREWRAHGASLHLLVYDLLPIERSEWFTAAAVSNFRKWYEFLATDADQAICISDHVSRGLRQALDAYSLPRMPEISRIRMGADIAASRPSKGICEKAQCVGRKMRSRPTVLMVGTIEPRKGYEAALSAFDQLWKSRTDAPDLVLVGKAGWKTEAVQQEIRSHSEFGSRLHWLDGVSDESLCDLYDASRGILMASRGEGWGLPLVEAAMHRRYVLARDLPVFREQALPNVLYFSDDSPYALSRRILDLIQLGEHPAPVPCLPTWSDSVDGLLNALGIGGVAGLVESNLRKAS